MTLVVVANRLPRLDPVTNEIVCEGGLAVGMMAALKSAGGGVWFGWNGEIKDKDVLFPLEDRTSAIEVPGNITVRGFAETRHENTNHYANTSNKEIWPISHQLAEKITEDGSSFEEYIKVNNLFAKQLKPHLKPEDVVWVQDYHLMMMAESLRARNVTNELRYFHHIPVPSRDFVESLSEAHKSQTYRLLQALFAYDCVAFQSERDLRNFMDLIGAKADMPNRFEPVTLSFNGSTTQFMYSPISIDPHEIRKTAEVHANDDDVAEMMQSAAGKPIIMSGERRDYTKGLVERLEALDRFFQNVTRKARLALQDLLKTRPANDVEVAEATEEVRRVTPIFKQVAYDTRAGIDGYDEITVALRKKTAEVNGRHSTTGWTPVQTVEHMVPYNSLMAHFRRANVGMATPLMDGQNLTAKEYIAAQDPANPGVLILSKFAGAAEELGQARAALIVDPRNADEVAAAVEKALKMPLDERIGMHQRGWAWLEKYDAANWTAQCLKPLRAAEQNNGGTAPASQPRLRMVG